MRVIAVSGSTGTGKTTILNILRDMGHGVVNSDEVAHRILEEYGDIRTVRMKFFTDPEFRAVHERWIRPKIYRRIIKEVLCLFLRGHSTIFIEIPLLFELKLNPYFYTIVVICDRNLQMKRTRHMEYLSERLALQLPIEEKVRLAQLVVDNSGDMNELESRISVFDFGGCNIYSCLAILLATILLTLIHE